MQAPSSGAFTFGINEGPFSFSGFTGATRAEVEYAITFNGVNSAEIYESGVYKFETTYAVSDTFSVGIQGGLVSYYKNGIAISTSKRPSVGILSLIVMLGSPGMKVINLSFSGNSEVLTPTPTPGSEAAAVNFAQLISATSVAGSITSIGWNAGGRSLQTLFPENSGQFRVQAPSAGTFTFGLDEGEFLISGNPASDRASLEYAISFNGVTSAEFYESGVYRGETTYSGSDIFSIGIQANLVSFYKNGNLIYSGARVPVGVLHLSVLMVNPSVTVSNCYYFSSTAARPTPTATPTPASTPTLDLFLIAGQSNAVGHGDAAKAPLLAEGAAFQYSNGIFSNAARTGSAWPAFSVEYSRLTGRVHAFIPSAGDGSALVQNADSGAGSWSPAGTLFQRSVNELKAAQQYLQKQNQNSSIKGILWAQGETDALSIQAKVIAKEHYKAALKDLVARFRIAIGADVSFFIFRTGTQYNGSDSGFKEVREAQEEVAQEMPLVYIVFKGAVDFPNRALMSDAYHYTQDGYNEMGTLGARGVFDAFSVPTATPTPASTPTPMMPTPTPTPAPNTACLVDYPGPIGSIIDSPPGGLSEPYATLANILRSSIAVSCTNAPAISIPSSANVASCGIGCAPFVDLYVQNLGTCPVAADNEVPVWIRVYSGAFKGKTYRYRVLSQGERTGFHIDLSALKGQSAIVTVVTESKKTCASLGISPLAVDVRKTMLPNTTEALATETRIMAKFSQNLERRPGISLRGASSWQRTDSLARNAQISNAGFVRPILAPLVANFEKCSPSTPNDCFDADRDGQNPNLGSVGQLEKIDGMVEALFYRDVPLWGLFHGVSFSHLAFQENDNDFWNDYLKTPAIRCANTISKIQSHLSHFKFSPANPRYGKYWGYPPDGTPGGQSVVMPPIGGCEDVRFVGAEVPLPYASNLRDNEKKLIALIKYVQAYYQIFRYDVNNAWFNYGINQWMFERYKKVIVGVEAGNEQNWHEPSIRGLDQSFSDQAYYANPSSYVLSEEQNWVIAESKTFFVTFCNLAKSAGKLCFAPAMASGMFDQKGPYGLNGYDMLLTYGDALKLADYGNIHYYFDIRDGEKSIDDYQRLLKMVINGGTYSSTRGPTTYNRSVPAGGYAGLMPGKKFVITEWGYAEPIWLQGGHRLFVDGAPVDNYTFTADYYAIRKMRKFFTENKTQIAGSAYWQDVYDYGMPTSADVTDVANALSSLFYLGHARPGSADCPLVNNLPTWCPFMQWNLVPHSAGGPDDYLNQFTEVQ